MKMFPEERTLFNQVFARIKAAGQYRYHRGLPPHPGFKDMERAADRFLNLVQPDQVILSMRDQCLGPFIRRAIDRDFCTLIPNDSGEEIYRLPPSFTYKNPDASQKPLRLRPLPFGTELYRGGIDYIVVGCTAWSSDRMRLWSLDWDRTSNILEALGYRFGTGMRTTCLAANEQEVESTWPGWAAGHFADEVVTQTRVIPLKPSAEERVYLVQERIERKILDEMSKAFVP